MVLDLPHGILSLDDFPFSPQTTMDELLEQPKGENRYIFPWGHISAVADISPRSEHNAGYIVLNYNQTV